MFTKLFILMCALTAVLAYPRPEVDTDAAPVYYVRYYEPEPAVRVRRQLQLSGGGGGSPRNGYDISINGRAPVWKSDNGAHQVDLSGGYAQHLGGPYGNSRPNYSVGAGYTFRF